MVRDCCILDRFNPYRGNTLLSDSYSRHRRTETLPAGCDCSNTSHYPHKPSLAKSPDETKSELNLNFYIYINKILKVYIKHIIISQPSDMLQ